MEAFAPYLFVIILLIPAVLLIAQVSASLGRQGSETERERVTRQMRANVRRRAETLHHREHLADAREDRHDGFTPNVIAEAFDKFEPRPPRPPDEPRRR